MLKYSNVSHTTHKKETIDLNVKVTKVLEDVELDIQQKQAIIEVQQLPQIKGYRRQIQQMFQNLLSNALKYSKAGIPPHIVISAEKLSKNENEPVFSGNGHTAEYYLIKVADNGIGFDPEKAERIFQMFQRLHGK